MENPPEVTDLQFTEPGGSGDQAPYPRPTPDPLSRNFFGWILLVILFVIVAGGAVTQSFRRADDVDPKVKTTERMVESSVAVSELLGRNGASENNTRKGLTDARESITGTSPDSALMRILIDRELGRPPAETDVKRARAGGKELKEAVTLATTEKPKNVAAPHPDERFAVRWAKAQARERAGMPRKEARQGLVRPDYLPRFAAFLVGIFGAAALGFALLIWYVISRASGNFVPKGLPSLPMTPAQGDRFALRAAMMFGGFLLGSTAISLLKLPGTVAMLAQVAVMGGIAAYALRLPPDPKVPHLSAAGLELNTRQFGERAAWGVAGAFANIPILLAVATISGILLKNAPAPSHPSTDLLSQNANVVTVLITFLLASVCAPIWEEVMFRGLLFQGLAGIRFKPVIAALLSSFLFAAIHPQGLAAWPALAGVALMSCALLAQTRSLVPSIVMHTTHNTLLLMGALIAGPVIG